VPVNSTHVEYAANAAAWLRARDGFAGENGAKAGCDRYLPELLFHFPFSIQISDFVSLAWNPYSVSRTISAFTEY
jgi:hypothetical protein